MIKAVIFDVDGTLVDTVDMHAEAWQRALKEVGKNVDFKEVRAQIGKGADQLMPVFMNEDELKKSGEKAEKRHGEIFQGEFLKKAEPFADAKKLIAKIKADGKRVALASSAVDKELEHYKKLLGIEDLLDGETTSDDAEESKPEPDIFAAALKKIGSPSPEETIVVGDTPYDAIAAGKINLKTIGFLCGGFPEKDLRDAGCVEIYENPADLLARLGESLISKDEAKAAE